MEPNEASDIAGALGSVDAKDHSALDRAFAEHYPALKKLAHARLRGTGLEAAMQTTALVHESYLKLAGGTGIAIDDRVHFLAYSSRVLRSIVVDLVREQRALCRGGDYDMVTLDTAIGEGLAGEAADVVAVDGALDALAGLDPALARLVEMRFFGGMTEPEIAEALGVSVRTVSREWQKARALLLTLMSR